MLKRLSTSWPKLGKPGSLRANLNVANRSGSTPLYERAKLGDRKALTFVIDFNQDIISQGYHHDIFDFNKPNIKDLEMTCLHCSCLLPTLILLAEILSDVRLDVLRLDYYLETAYQKVPSNFLTSRKLVCRYERSAFIKKRLQKSYARYEVDTKDHDVTVQFDQLDGPQTSRSIPLEFNCSEIQNLGSRIKEGSSKAPIIGKPQWNMSGSLMRQEANTPNTTIKLKANIFKEFKDSRLMQSRPVLKMMQIPQRPFDTPRSIFGGKSQIFALEDRHVSQETSNLVNRETNYCLNDGVALREKLKMELIGNDGDLSSSLIDQPLSIKIKGYSTYNAGFLGNKSKQQRLTDQLKFSEVTQLRKDPVKSLTCFVPNRVLEAENISSSNRRCKKYRDVLIAVI